MPGANYQANETPKIIFLIVGVILLIGLGLSLALMGSSSDIPQQTIPSNHQPLIQFSPNNPVLNIESSTTPSDIAESPVTPPSTEINIRDQELISEIRQLTLEVKQLREELTNYKKEHQNFSNDPNISREDILRLIQDWEEAKSISRKTLQPYRFSELLTGDAYQEHSKKLNELKKDSSQFLIDLKSLELNDYQTINPMLIKADVTIGEVIRFYKNGKCLEGVNNSRQVKYNAKFKLAYVDHSWKIEEGDSVGPNLLTKAYPCPIVDEIMAKLSL